MITKQQVIDAQKEWGAGVVKIGSLKDQRSECESFTSDFLDDLYSFESGLGCACKEDGGFAINPWTKVRFENSDFILEDNRAIAMGNYFFTDLDGNEAKVEYTFGYKLLGNKLKIDLHHSSFPYNL